MLYFTGIDIGSTAIKIALLDEQDQILASHTAPTGSQFNQNTVDAFNGLIQRLGLAPEDCAYTVSTGYGRKLYKTGNEFVSEITANAAGVRALGPEYAGIRTIINVGGQDSKVIQMSEKGTVLNFAMNDKCAAGTGRFLEIAARNLEVDFAEFSALHLDSAEVPAPVNSTCAVFAESEIISLLATGHNKGAIAAGIHHSIARRICRLANRIGVKDQILFDGGTALNEGMLIALEDELMHDIMVAQYPQNTTALGAAVIAKKRFINSA